MIIMMIFIEGCFSACNNDDNFENDEGFTKSMILGRWISTECYDSDGNAITSYENEIDGFGIEFDSDGTFVYYHGGYTLGGNWQDIWELKYLRRTGTYTISKSSEGDRVDFIFNDDDNGHLNKTASILILSLNNNRMKSRGMDNKIWVFERFS